MRGVVRLYMSQDTIMEETRATNVLPTTELRRHVRRLLVNVAKEDSRQSRFKPRNKRHTRAMYNTIAICDRSSALICDRNGEVTARRRDDVGLSLGCFAQRAMDRAFDV